MPTLVLYSQHATGLLIPPKYDFTSGVDANSWVFNYAPPPTAHTKTAANKDLDAAHKNSKLPSKSEGAKDGGDLMGIVGKKVPRQESNTASAATAAGSKTANVASEMKNDQRETLHWAAEESALKRQKAATGSTTATPTPPPRNPWADSPAPASAPAPVSVAAHQKNQKPSSTPNVPAAGKEDAKKTSNQGEFKIHSAKFTDEEEEEEEEREVKHTEGAMDVATERTDSTPSALPAPKEAAAGVPPGGIKFSGKLKQKLGATAAVPTSTPTTIPASAAAVAEPLLVPEHISPLDMLTGPGATTAQNSHEDVTDEIQSSELPHPHTHSLPLASPVLPGRHRTSPGPVRSVNTMTQGLLKIPDWARKREKMGRGKTHSLVPKQNNTT